MMSWGSAGSRPIELSCEGKPKIFVVVMVVSCR